MTIQPFLFFVVFLIAGVLLTILFYVIIGNLFTFRAEHITLQEQFSKGKAVNNLDGDYKGSASIKGTWLGKHFNLNSKTGINNFLDNNNVHQEYPFKTYIEKGARDNIDVIKIDYNIPENPFYIRWILDEIVEIAPGKYLGKVHMRMIPFVPFTIMYFWLEKS